MTIISCVDNQLGLLFNNRRQSQDYVIFEKIFFHFKKQHQQYPDAKFYMNTYSRSLFEEYSKHINDFSNISSADVNWFKANIIVSDNFLDLATKHDFCFVETDYVFSYLKEGLVDGIILYHWNTTYPHDFVCDIPIDAISSYTQLSLDSSIDFIGNSHKKITEEIFKRDETI
ncbi:hypothetical protein SAMN04487761_1192 [Lachnospiraceae bacterium C7]|nr:hypothetical protein SAMN04487761_1192 [Lachnospiraceae bacterium C7]